MRMSKRRARRRASRGVCEKWTVRYHPHFRWDICILFVLKRARVNATVVSLQVSPYFLVTGRVEIARMRLHMCELQHCSCDKILNIANFPQVPLTLSYASYGHDRDLAV